MSPLQDKRLTAAVGPAVGALVALVGVLTGLVLSGLQGRRQRYEAHVWRVVEKRYELYLRYLSLLDRNADILSGDDVLDGVELTTTDLHLVEKEMRLFASNEVLVIADRYRDEIRAAYRGGQKLEEQQRSALRQRLPLTSCLLLAAMRADPGIKRLSFGTRRSRYKAFKSDAKREVAEHRRPVKPSMR